MDLCVCGCNRTVRLKHHKFIHGHNRKGVPMSEEHKRKISKSEKGKIITKETKLKMSKSAKGKKLSEETKKKLSIAFSGKNNPFYGKKHKVHPMQGKRHTKRSKEKMRKSHIGQPAWNKGKKTPEEVKRKISKSEKGKIIPLEVRKRTSKTMLRKIALGEIKLLNKSFDTSIEIIIEKQLKKFNLKYEKQKYIKGVGLVDFFLSDFNIIIECDGDYWHNLPGAQEKDLGRDFSSEFLHQYKTIRFWEHEINKSPEKCMKKILKFVN